MGERRAWRARRRAAKFYVWTQAEAGHGCPISMTYSVVPALRHAPELAARFEPLLTCSGYDPGLRAPETKAGLLAGMAMTEKQGGSDVRANTTRAVPAGDGSYLLTGHKWFCSAPMCDLFLVLAQAEAGLTCFLLPRVLPDGSRNAMHLQRLKDKLGNRSNASSEVEYDEAVAWPVGEPGRGVRDDHRDGQLDPARLHPRQRRRASGRPASRRRTTPATGSAFGAPLADQPAMTAVLADLALESEAATTLAIRLAGAADRAARGDAGEAALLRLLLPAAKHWICKRTPAVDRRGAGVPGRQRLRRGVGHAPAVPGRAAELDLGGLGQRHRARPAARARPLPGGVEALRAELSLAAGADRQARRGHRSGS